MVTAAIGALIALLVTYISTKSLVEEMLQDSMPTSTAGMLMMITLIIMFYGMCSVAGGIIGYLFSYLIGVFMPQQKHEQVITPTNILRTSEVRTHLITTSVVVGEQATLTSIPVTRTVPVIKITYLDSNQNEVVTTVDETIVDYKFHEQDKPLFVIKRSWSFPSSWMELFGTASDTEWEIHRPEGVHI